MTLSQDDAAVVKHICSMVLDRDGPYGEDRVTIRVLNLLITEQLKKADPVSVPRAYYDLLLAMVDNQGSHER